MRKLFALLATLVSFSGMQADAQNVTTNGGSGLAATYPDLASAVTALNAATISGPVVITLNANETAPAGGYVITAEGSAANPITIQGGGASRSTVITANGSLASGSLNDALIKLRGADYVTIQNLTLRENTSNTTTAAATNNMTEWGVALLYASATNGAQNNTIQNNNITLNRSYTNSFGVYSNTRHADLSASVGTAADASSAAGSNSNNRVYGNSISNVNLPIAFIGSSTAAAQDNGNEIGASGNGNTLSDWGNAATASTFIGNTGSVCGIFLNHQQNSTVRFNTLTSATVSGSATVRGIQQEFTTTSPTAVTFTNTISNNAITLNSTSSGAVTGILNQTLSALATATVNINSNVLTANTVASAFTGILSSQGAGTLNMNSNTVRGTVVNGTSNSFVGISSTGSVQSAVNINNNNLGDAVSGAVNFAGTTSGTVVGINCTGATAATTFNIKNNDFRGFTYTTSGTGAHTYINLTGATAAGAVATVEGNTFTNLNVNTTGSVTFMATSYTVAATGTQTINNNSIVGSFNKAGAGGTVTGHTSSSSSVAGATINHTNNNFSNITVTGATAITGWFSSDGGTANKNYTNNTFNNFSGGTGAVLGMSVNFGGGGGGNGNVLSGNVISNLSGGAAVTGISLGGSGTAHSAIGNTIFNLSSNGASTVTGITSSAPTTGNIIGNKIYDLSNSNASGSVVGIAVTGGTTHNVYNNLVSGLTTPAANVATGVPNTVIGINISGGTTANIYYNTVYLTGTGGANFGSSGVLYNTSPTTVTLRNNIIINKTTPSGTGLAVALRRNNGTAAAGAGNYGATSNNNLFYAGIPGASNLIYSEYNSSTFATTNNLQTLAAYKTFMATRDQQSYTEDVPFQSTTGSSSNFLKYSTSVGTIVESGGAPVAGITTDFAGTARNSSTPDLGAWELTGVGLLPAVSNFAVNPSTVQCAATNHEVSVTATPNASSGAALTSVRLYYTVNGIAQSPVSMTNTSGNTWTASIPGTNAAITYYVIVTDANGLTSTTSTGSYQDNPLRLVTPGATATPLNYCAGSTVTLNSNFTSALPATYAATNGASTPLTDEDLGTVTLSQGGSTIFTNTSTANSLTGTLGTATGVAGGYSNFTAFGPFNVIAGQTYDFSLSSITAGTGNFGNLMAIFIDYNRDGDFADAGELVYSSTASTSGPHTETGSFLIPATANNGQTRMRVIVKETSTPISSGTEAVTWGEYEDYLLSISSSNNGGGGALPTLTYSWSDGSNTIGSGASLTVSPAGNMTYIVTGTDVNNCLRSASVTLTEVALPAAPTASNSTQCGVGVPSASVSGAGGTFKWYSAATGGTLLQSGGSTYTTSISSSTTFYVSETNGQGCEGPRVAVTATVNQPDAVTASASAGTICAGGVVNLSVAQTGSANSYTYAWTASPAAGSGIATSMAGQNISVSPNAAGSYTYTVTATDASANCAAASTVTVTVGANPVVSTVTGPSSACSGAPVALSASSIGIGPGSATVGTNNASELTTTGVPYRTGNTLNNEIRNQYLITATEMTAAGFSAGNITSLSFFVTTAAPTGTMSNMVWKMANVPQTVLTTTYLAPSFTTVLTQATYSPVTGANTHTFTTPFVWDGSSSILVEVCGKLTTTGSGVSIQTTTTSGTTTVHSATSTGCTDATGTAATGRPVIRFTGQTAADISSSYTWTWMPGNLSGASVTATAPVNTTGAPVNQVYTARATNAATGCYGESTVTVSILPAPTAPGATNSTQCGTQVPTASVTSTSGAATPSFKWYSAASGGTLLQSGTGTAYASAISATTTFYVSEVNSAGCESPRTPVTVTITSPDAVTASVDNNNACPGTAISLSASNTGTSNNYTYSWSASPVSGSGIATPVSGNPVSVTPTASGTFVYTVTATDAAAGCVTTATVSVTTKPVAPITSITATPATVCSGGTVALAAASVPSGAGTASLGTQTTTSITGGPYRSGASTPMKVQYLFTKAELNAAGLVGGNITSLAFNVTSVGDAPLTNFTISMAHTSTSAMTSSFDPAPMTTVLAPVTYTAVLGQNTHTFTTPFNWDGTSNIIVQVCHDEPTGTTSSTMSLYVPGHVSTVYATTANACAGAATGTSSSNRPTVVFGGRVGIDQTAAYTWTWMPGNLPGASVNATAPVNMTGSPVVQSYTATASGANGCSSSATVNVTVNPVPAAPTASNSTQCGTAIPTASVSGAGGTYKWYSAASGGTLLQTGGTGYGTAISQTTTFYVSETNSYGCESARSAVTVTVSSPDAVTASVNNPTTCPGSFISLSAARTGSTNNYTYSWTASPVSGSGILTSVPGQNVNVMPTAAGTYTYTVTATDASAGCATTATVSVTVNVPPVVSTATASVSTVCSGGNVTLSATSIGTGAGTTTIGAGSTTSSTYNAPFYSLWSNKHMQIMIKASELTAAHLAAGPITALSFPATVIDGTDLNLNFSIRLTQTTASDMSAFVMSGLTQVYSIATYNQEVGNNRIALTAPYNWDGTSNLVIDICFYNTSSGATLASTAPVDPTSFVSVIKTHTSTASASGSICSDVATNLASYSERPKVIVEGRVDNANITNTLEWQWNPGGLDGATVTATPENLTTTNESQAFTVTAINPATGCSSSSSVNVMVYYNPSAPNVDNPGYTQCGTQVPTGASVTSTDGSSSPVFVWYDRASGGTPLQSGALNYYNSPVASTTTFYVSERNGSCEGPRAAVEVTVSEPDPVTAGSSASGNICPNATISLSASSTGRINNYTQFEWTASPAAGSGIPTSMSGQHINVTPTAPGTYTYTVTATDLSAGCATTATVSVTVNNVPTITTATGPASVCPGSPVALAATYVAPGAGSATVGTNNATDLSTTGVPYRTGNTLNNEIRNQYLITAAELTAAGFSAGNISSITFFVTTASPTGTMSNMVWKMANVPNTVLTTTYLAPSFTTVLTQATYSPVTGANTHTFTTPFVWDGTSSILVDVCGKLTTTGSGVAVQTTTTTGTTTVHTASTTACTATTGGAATGRPVIRFAGQVLTTQNGTYNWTWTPGNLSGASVTATAPMNLTGAPVTQVYTVTATNPTTGCTNTRTVSVTVNPAPVAPTASNSTQCGFGVPAASVTGAGGTYKWYSAATGGTLLQTGGTSYTTAISQTTTFYVSETGANGCEGPRVAVTATVNQPDAISASVNNNAICLGASINLSVAQTGSTNNYTYSWTSTSGSGITTAQAGQALTVTPTAAGTYTYTVTATDAGANCTAASTVSVTVNANPVITSASGPASVCSGAPVALTAASVPAAAGTATIGAQTTTSTTGSPYRGGSTSGNKIQYLFTAAELNAAGIQAGNINSLSFNVTAAATAVGGTLPGFTISMGATAATTVTTTFATLPTTVFGPVNYTPVSNAVNTHVFTTPFTWDGVSNIIIQLCHGPASPTETSLAVSVYPPGATRTVQNATGNCTSATGTTSTNRAVIGFGAQVGTNLTSNYTWTWNPGNLAGASVTATAPVNNTGAPVTQVYSVRASNATTGCFSESTVSVTVSASISAPTATNSTQCAPGVPSASVVSTSGASTPTFKWYTAATGGTVAQSSTSTTYTSSVSSTTMLYVAEVSAQGCESARTPVTITVNTPPDISVSAAPAVLCNGGQSTLSVSSANANYTYTWSPASSLYTDAAATVPYAAGAPATTLYAKPNATTTYTVTATDAGTGCTTSATQVVTLSASSPTAPVITPASATVCNTSAQPLTASSTNALPASILAESFNGASSWTTANASTGGTPAAAAWTLRANNYNYNGTTFRSNDNSQFYMSNSEAQGTGGSTSTTLTSPAFSTEGYSAATVGFFHYFVFNTGDAARVEASTDGSNWTILQTYASTQGSPTVFSSGSIALTPAFLNKPSVRVRFRYTANFGSYWAIDNVSVTGTAAPLSYVWSPVAGLYTDVNGTVPYTGTSAATVYAKINSAQTYTVTASNISGCSASNSVSLQVVQSSVAPTSLNASSSVICSGLDVILTQTGGSLGAGAQWQWYSDASYGAAFKVGGPLTAANAQLTVSPTATTTYYLRAEGGTAPCAATVSGAASVSVTVPGAAVGGSASSDQTITAGTAPAALHLSEYSGQVTRWTSATNQAFTQGVQHYANTSATLTGAEIGALSQTRYFRAEVSSSGCSTDYSSTVTITVIPCPAAFTVQGSGTYCDGAGRTVTLSGSEAGMTYQLRKGSAPQGAPLQGTGSALSFGVQPAGTYTVVASNGAGCAVTMTGAASIQDLGLFSASIAAQNAMLCSGNASTTILITGGPASGQVTYTTNGQNPQTVTLDASGAYSFVTGALTQNTTYTLTGVSNGSCTTPTSVSATVYVSQLQPDVIANQVVCSGSTLAGVAFTGAFAPGTTFAWVNSNTSIGLAASGTGTELPAFTALNDSDTTALALVSVTPVLPAGTSSDCKAGRTAFYIRVSPRPTVDAVAPQVLCAGTTSPGALFTSPIAGTSFAWTNSNPEIGLAASGGGDIAPFLAQNNTASSSISGTITVTPYKDGCVGTPRTFQITVNKSASSISYGGTAFCQVGTIVPRVAGTSGGTFSSTPAGLALNTTTGAIVLGASTPGTYQVSYSVAGSAGACGGTFTLSLRVNPQVTVQAIANEVYCNGAATAPIAFAGTATQYRWTNSNASIGLAASGVGTELPSFVATNTGATVQYAFINVTPLGNGTTSCDGKPVRFRITVSPTPTVAAVAAQVYCRGVLTAPITFTGNMGTAATYNWTSSSAATGLTATRGVNTVPSFVTANATSGVASSTITVTPVAGKCPGAPISFSYQVGNCVAQGGGSGNGGTDAARTNTPSPLQGQVTVGPNPTQSRVTVFIGGGAKASQAAATYSVRLVDQHGGALTRPASFTGTSYTLDLTGLPAGTYLVQLTDTKSGETIQKKVIKL